MSRMKEANCSKQMVKNENKKNRVEDRVAARPNSKRIN